MHVRTRSRAISGRILFRVAALLCFVALLPSAMAYQAVISSQQAGSISGHVFTDTAHPVQEAAITLLNSQTKIHQVTHSDASEAYVFSSLPAGQYLLLAFHAGYFAEYFNMVPQKGHAIEGSKTLRGSSHSFMQGVTLPTDQAAVIADFNLKPSPPIRALRDESLSASYSTQERAQLSFCSGIFSPDLRYLAIRTTGIVSGDPEQVWRYELANGQLVPVTPTPTLATGPEILSIHWTGGALHVTGIDRSDGRQFKAELSGQASPSITYTQQSYPWPQAEDPLGSAGRYTLTPTVLHGGSASWTAQLDGSGRKKLIAAALLNAPVVDATIPFFCERYVKPILFGTEPGRNLVE